MDSLEILSSQKILDKDFTIYGDVDNPLFLAKDISTWIEHSNARMMLQSVGEDEKVCVNNPYALKGQQEQWFLTEDGLYEVLMQSRKPIAKQFKSEMKTILKTIRKTGGYIASADLMIQTYFSDSSQEQQSLIKLYLEKITNQQKAITELDYYNQLLSDKNLEFDYNTIFNALIHSIAGKCNEKISKTFNRFYKQFNKTTHINVKGRTKGKKDSLLSLLSPREKRAAISLAASFAREIGCNITCLLNKYNVEKIKEYDKDYEYYVKLANENV